jgi:type II secretory pathway pseudopilin PulG
MMHAYRRQRGIAAVVLVALLGIVLAGILLTAMSGSRAAVDREQQTQRALGQARDALIARAAADDNRPGSLPCPDVNDDGQSTPMDDWSGSQCGSYIGRLPWKTLDLPDLRDGNGERLWYALSPNFRDSSSAGSLNSSEPGVLAVSGTVSLANMVALVIAPGEPLSGQNRVGAGLLLVSEYLEGENADSDPDYELQRASPTFNDESLVIGPDTLFPPVERRVAREARVCLEKLALTTGGRYPWAAPMSDPVVDVEALNTFEGRVPRTLPVTDATLGTAHPWPSTDFGVQCFAPSTWWDDWHDAILYHVSPDVTPDSAGGGMCTTNCLTVNGVASPAVVMVAGRALSSPDQSGRSGNQNVFGNYLEAANGIDNADGPSIGDYVRAPTSFTSSPAFNDRVECVGTAAC